MKSLGFSSFINSRAFLLYLAGYPPMCIISTLTSSQLNTNTSEVRDHFPGATFVHFLFQ